MCTTGAVIFLPREANGSSPMLENLVFSPAALWLAQALGGAEVSRFFVVCHSDDQARAAVCFPAGTPFVTGGGEDAGDRLVSFLSEVEQVLIFTRPVFVTCTARLEVQVPWLAGPGTGVHRMDAVALREALEGGAGLDVALREGEEYPRTLGGILPLEDLSAAQDLARRDAVERLSRAGVHLIDQNNVYLDPTVRVGSGTVLLPGTILRGATVIGSNCEIGPNTMIRDCTIGDQVTVNASQLNGSVVADRATVGPFAYIRPGCHIGPDVKVGDFVELKNSVIGSGTKISHLTYVGDADVGGGVNFGCGTVTVNYDGDAKFRTSIGDNAFIGCNTNLVAPVRVGDGAYTAAGSTITNDVPPDSLAIARSHQVVKKQWAAKRRRRR